MVLYQVVHPAGCGRRWAVVSTPASKVKCTDAVERTAALVLHHRAGHALGVCACADAMPSNATSDSQIADLQRQLAASRQACSSLEGQVDSLKTQLERAQSRFVSCERSYRKRLAFGLAKLFHSAVLNGNRVEAALLARDKRFVKQREHRAFIVHAWWQDPSQHRAIDLQLLEAGARKSIQPHLFNQCFQRELGHVREHASHRWLPAARDAEEACAEGDLAREHAL